jgi:hypothetical protein
MILCISRSYELHGTTYRIFTAKDYYALFSSPLGGIKSVEESHYVFSLLTTYPFLLLMIS